MIFNVPMSIVSSYIMKRFGLRASMFVGVMLNFIGGCVRFAGFKRGNELFLWIIFVGQCITAIARPFIGNASTLFASNWFGEKERATATSVGSFFSVLGSAAIFGIAPWLVSANSEIGMAVLLGVEATIAGVLLVVFVAV